MLAVAELGPGTRVEQIDGDAGRVDGRQLEGHLHTLLAGLAQVQDPAHARLQPGLANGGDRAQASLVSHRRGDLVVVALGRLHVVVDALDTRFAQRLGPRRGHVPDRRAALEAGVLGDQARAGEDAFEVALGEPLPLGHHAKAVGSRGLGGPCVLEDLLGLHHRVHRGLGLGEARLGAEAAVLGAPA